MDLTGEDATASGRDDVDLLVVGGGINGAGIARDAAGRGLRVMLVEADDLASHTSSASTKLVHGGLRYLEQYEFRLVRESLIERERLLAVAPHIIWPLQFVLPEDGGGRPRWMMRLGLWLYDNLGPRRRLPRSFGVTLQNTVFGHGLKQEFRRGFVYSDCWVDDARLVAINCVDAAERGACIRTRTEVVGASPANGRWMVRLRDKQTGAETVVGATAIANAAGTRVSEVLASMDGVSQGQPLRLVKGSHIIVPSMFEGAHAYIFQNPDKRIVFAIPYEGCFTLIGTTEVNWLDAASPPVIEAHEVDYLCESVNRYFDKAVSPADVVHHFSGVRPLVDDGSPDSAEVTRGYVLRLEHDTTPPILSVFGGKITTYRSLAQKAVDMLGSVMPGVGGAWTEAVPLPGGDLTAGSLDAFAEATAMRWPFLEPDVCRRLCRSYGTRVATIIGGAQGIADLGEHFGGGLYAREIDYLVDREWALTAEDILWRRTKLGLHLGAHAEVAIDRYLAQLRRA